MIYTPEKAIHSACSCGADLKFIESGTVVHKIRDKEIRVRNVPHYECGECKQVEYDITRVKVMPLLRKALKENINEIDYEQGRML